MFYDDDDIPSEWELIPTLDDLLVDDRVNPYFQDETDNADV